MLEPPVRDSWPYSRQGLQGSPSAPRTICHWYQPVPGRCYKQLTFESMSHTCCQPVKWGPIHDRSLCTAVSGFGTATPRVDRRALQAWLEVVQRGLKETPEYRNVMQSADRHALWLAGLVMLSNPTAAPRVSSKETEPVG